jgi:diacylglycerol kinase family enzyme
MCRTESRAAYLRYIAGALLGLRWEIDGIDLVSCSEMVCKLPKPTSVESDGRKKDRVYVEADGELLGRLPARMTMVADALSLVVPGTKEKN